MATYKVLQDIEAEDKLLGPLTLKQFIFAVLTLGMAYIGFLLIMRGLGLLALIFVPPMVVTGFLAWPWGREQPTEIWLIAKLRFFFKPRKRIWDQSGLKELVTVTAPVKETKVQTDGLSQGEVKSRLQALANTIDSRGWAVKNVNVNLFAPPGTIDNSDRLVEASTLAHEVVGSEVSASDDILDEQNNQIAQNLDRMIHASSAAYRQQVVDQVKQAAQAPVTAEGQQPDYWFMSQPSGPIPAGQAVFDSGQTVQPQAPALPATFDSAVAVPAPTPVAYGNMRTVNPAGQPPAPSSKTPDPAILELANNDDLDVATIARQANKKVSDMGDGEVVVPLR